MEEIQVHQPTETPEFLAAFAKAQAKFKPAIKDSNNPHFGSKYADLNAVWEACKEALAANDLLVMQPTFLAPDGKLMLRTRVYHIKGGYTESIMPVLADNMNKAQSMGSGLTYTRRYSLAATLGIVVDDDDAEAATDRSKTGANKALQATQPAKQSTNTNPPANVPQKPATKEQKAEILNLLKNPAQAEVTVKRVTGKLEDFTYDDALKTIVHLKKQIALASEPNLEEAHAS